MDDVRDVEMAWERVAQWDLLSGVVWELLWALVLARLLDCPWDEERELEWAFLWAGALLVGR